MKRGGNFFVFSWYFFLIVNVLNFLLGFALLGSKGAEGVGMIVGSVWGLWFLTKVKDLIEEKSSQGGIEKK